ncbi:MAG: outer membrane beta-barrel protein [Bryobacterales bacterium]|nr:outer membrane beta-barrel protein [Bryobacterales bacterium]
MMVLRWLPVALLFAGSLTAQDSFVGGFFGVSTLSGDARTDVTAAGARFSSYKPENGATAVAFGGRHLTDFFSVMGSYSWNRNAVLLAYGSTVPAEAYAQPFRATLHTGMGEGMLYFRNRRSRVRPYLSTGMGFTRTQLQADGAPVVSGVPARPADSTSRTGPAFRFAVGIDLMMTKRAAFRYSFSETIQGNPMSEALTPVGQRKLANFQNWFGFAFFF